MESEPSPSNNNNCTINITSYGVKNGGVKKEEYDLLKSVKNIENPSKKLRKYDGRSKEIQKELFQNQFTLSYFTEIYNEIIELISNSKVKKELRIGIFCEFGKHRSVAFVERLKNELSNLNEYEITLNINHRDLENNKNKTNKKRGKKKSYMYKDKSFKKHNF